MDKRIITLLKCLCDSNKTAYLLSTEIQMSTKTVRKLIKSWNEDYDSYGIKIYSKNGQGYYIHEDDKARLKTVLEEVERKQAENQIPETSRERVVYLLEELLKSSFYLKIDDLSEQLYISRKTISADLKEVSKLLVEYNLRIVSRPNYGITIEGKEFDKRACLSELFAKKQQKREEGNDSRDCLKIIEEIVEAVFVAEGFVMNAVVYKSFLVHLYIAVERIRKGLLMESMFLKDMELKKQKEYQVAEKLVKALETSFQVQFTEEELLYIAIHLAGKETYLYTGTLKDENRIISQEATSLALEMILAVNEGFNIDFREDLELRMNLAQHVVPLIVRLKYNLRMKNPLLRKIKETYPLAYAMGLQASSVLKRFCSKEFSDDEVGYIAIAFALALERKNKERPKKNILIVCMSGMGSAKLLEYKYRNEFGSYIDQIHICQVNQLNHMDFSGIDYALTTVPIPIKIPIPIQEVSYFLETEEIIKIKKNLQEIGSEAPMIAYFDENLFFSHLDFQSREELMDFLCMQAIQKRNVSPSFRELVKKRELAAKTAFGNMVAMPHPYRAISEDTFVSVGILDEPILWENQQVQVIFLVSISKKRNKNLQHFYHVMAQLVMNRERIETLLQNQTYEQLMKELEEIEAEGRR